MPESVPAVGVVGVEIDGLAVGGEGLFGVVQEGQRADVAGRRRRFLERLRPLRLAALLDLLKNILGRPGLALG